MSWFRNTALHNELLHHSLKGPAHLAGLGGDYCAVNIKCCNPAGGLKACSAEDEQLAVIQPPPLRPSVPDTAHYPTLRLKPGPVPGLATAAAVLLLGFLSFSQGNVGDTRVLALRTIKLRCHMSCFLDSGSVSTGSWRRIEEYRIFVLSGQQLQRVSMAKEGGGPGGEEATIRQTWVGPAVQTPNRQQEVIQLTDKKIGSDRQLKTSNQNY